MTQRDRDGGVVLKKVQKELITLFGIDTAFARFSAPTF